MPTAPDHLETTEAHGSASRKLAALYLTHLAQECITNGWSRLQWAVLDWNAPSIAFYKSLGAVMMDDWKLCRVTGEALARLAGRAS